MPRVQNLHFVCVDDLNVTLRKDGLFSSGYWKISADAALSAEFLALHPSRDAISTRQGKIVGRHLVEHQGEKRYVFVVDPTDEPVAWKVAPKSNGS